ncbi:MAG: hypothetical protein MRZ79_21685 [Bacteroidia bacterium]|nr:hypothetical protein [Bacteroidia bacterium]
MRQVTSIKIFVWLLAASFLLVFFLLPSCTNGENTTDERKIRTLDAKEEKGIKAIANKGWMESRFWQDTLFILFNEDLSYKVKTVRIYDQSGGLKYLESNPDLSTVNGLKIDCTYFRNGEYLILAYLEDDQLIEESVILE